MTEYILLARDGVRGNEAQRNALLSLPIAQSTGMPQRTALESVAGTPQISILDTVHEDGPKLVQMDDATATQLNENAQAPMRAVPLVYYDRPNPQLSVAGAAAAAGGAEVIRCLDSVAGQGIPGANVVAFTDFNLRQGAQGVTDGNGEVNLNLTATTIERLYVYAPAGYWGAFRSGLAVTPPMTIDLTPVDLLFTDCLRSYYASSNFNNSLGVKVGIIDSGVGPHTDLNISATDSRNTVTGEPAANFQDGGSHGTHVAGIVGSNGSPGTGLRGMAPGVEMVALRVFPAQGGATNYAILKAMIYAADAGCDIINLSLGGGPADPIVREAIDDAREQGMLVVAAAGNDDRQPVSFPAAYNRVIAVSAMGREGTYPAGSLPEADVLRPPVSSSDPSEFIAAFSNIGLEINCTGPGVGVLSTLPNDNFGPMSGTSMAAPAVTGAAACLLSQNPTIYNMARDSQRADALWSLLVHNCGRKGFGATFEGSGLPDPSIV